MKHSGGDDRPMATPPTRHRQELDAQLHRKPSCPRRVRRAAHVSTSRRRVSRVGALPRASKLAEPFEFIRHHRPRRHQSKILQILRAKGEHRRTRAYHPMALPKLAHHGPHPEVCHPPHRAPRPRLVLDLNAGRLLERRQLPAPELHICKIHRRIDNGVFPGNLLGVLRRRTHSLWILRSAETSPLVEGTERPTRRSKMRRKNKNTRRASPTLPAGNQTIALVAICGAIVKARRNKRCG